MVSQRELIDIPTNDTVPNFAWHFLPLTVTLEMHFHNPGTKVTSAERTEGLQSLTVCRFPLAWFRGQKSNPGRLCLTGSWRKEARTLHTGFSPGLTLHIPLLLMSQGKVEIACHGCKPARRHRLGSVQVFSPERFHYTFQPPPFYLNSTVPIFALSSLHTSSQKGTSFEV